MINNNRAVQNFFESSESRRYMPHLVTPRTTQCTNTLEPLRECLIQKGVLAIKIDDSGCDMKQWKTHCTGVWRRHFIEQTFRIQMNRSLYKQQELDQYMRLKNNFPRGRTIVS